MAVKAIICQNKFPPTIAEIKQMMCKLAETKEDKRTEVEAWGQVFRAIKCSSYHAEECFEKFDNTLKKLVGSPNQLREWSRMEVDHLNTVVQSHFVRSYRNLSQQNKEYKLLPSDARKALGDYEPLKLPEKAEKKEANYKVIPLENHKSINNLKDAKEEVKNFLNNPENFNMEG